VTEDELLNIVRWRNYYKEEVMKWMALEGDAGRLRYNSDSPYWRDYEKYEGLVMKALHEVGTEPRTPIQEG